MVLVIFQVPRSQRECSSRGRRSIGRKGTRGCSRRRASDVLSGRAGRGACSGARASRISWKPDGVVVGGRERAAGERIPARGELRESCRIGTAEIGLVVDVFQVAVIAVVVVVVVVVVAVEMARVVRCSGSPSVVFHLLGLRSRVVSRTRGGRCVVAGLATHQAIAAGLALNTMGAMPGGNPVRVLAKRRHDLYWFAMRSRSGRNKFGERFADMARNCHVFVD